MVGEKIYISFYILKISDRVRIIDGGNEVVRMVMICI